MKIPRCMSTQHPDNAKQPFFAQNSVLKGDDEIKEAFYAYSHLGCTEQLWDCEGKEIDSFVIKKLLNKYSNYFEENVLGKDLFLTLRVPNPAIEKVEGKVLLETIESIPRSSDAARVFYKKDIYPIFEAALPMVTSADELNKVAEYYKKIVVGKQFQKLGNIMIKDWIGKFEPQEIRLIPLIETKKAMLNSAEIVKGYIQKNKIRDYVRVWLARSDPALNYSSVAAVLINKVSFQRLHELEQKESVEILPMIGCGSAPFRGNFNPNTVKDILNGYSSVQTFTLQSAFKYDYPIKDVKESIDLLNNSRRKAPIQIDEQRAILLIEKLSEEYSRQITLLADMVNRFVKYVPKRRMRKLHIGLFGYSREKGNIQLPRAIGFCASLYSVGMPPEVLGLSALSERDFEFLDNVYLNFRKDLADALQYINKDNFRFFPKNLITEIEKVLPRIDFEIDETHKKMTSDIMNGLRNGKSISEQVVSAAIKRRFLG
ncbi:MAG: Phosphoenolpyruvate carboxylase [Candidatus Woesearchaeota archaeon]|nr:Phosphoenolpyruvate carboxylase [Candidatus Woesearchaeota archaeon]